MTETKRKGARSTKDIPPAVMEQLNRGEIETANLVEWLAVDQKLLLKNLLKQSGRVHYLKPVLLRIEALNKQTVNTINEAIGTTLFLQAREQQDWEFMGILSKHSSDLVRCWAAYMIGQNPALTVGEKLGQMQAFAADLHFGVREISWLAVRRDIAENLSQSIEILTGWTSHENPNIRRFASEATRPRGVWCQHVEVLKQNPETGLPILEPLKSDNTKYVQDSVANWLNDASKTSEGFVRQLCQRWAKESPTKETGYIIKKALRTLDK